jgi:hypothetical protein
MLWDVASLEEADVTVIGDSNFRDEDATETLGYGRETAMRCLLTLDEADANVASENASVTISIIENGKEPPASRFKGLMERARLLPFRSLPALSTGTSSTSSSMGFRFFLAQLTRTSLGTGKWVTKKTSVSLEETTYTKQKKPTKD